MTGCLDDDTVWRMVRGDLAVAALASAEEHLDSCGDCRAVVAVVARGSTATVGVGGAARRLEPGATVGRYVVGERVGEGAMGVVYAAHDPELDRRVALKLLRDGGEDPARAKDRMWREAQAMARLAHPGVVTVHEVGVVDDHVFVAMELVAGATLRAWARQPGRRWQDVADVIVQVGRGLAAAHAADVVHRDVKPDNVIIGDDGRARIGDFGLARETAVATPDAGDTPVSATRTGTIVGTPAYMAPEVLRGGAADARADQFSLCVTAFEALHGARPFAGDTWSELLRAIERGEARRGGGDVPGWLDAIVRRGLAVKPEARWPSVAALVAAIEARRHGRRWVWIAGAAAAASAATAVVVLSMQGEPRAAATCDLGDDEIAAVWGAAARAKLDDDRVALALDAWSSRWAEARDAVCAEEPAARPVRDRCLDRRRAELGALIGLLGDADRDIALRAIDAVAALPAPEECAALVAGAADPLPADPGKRASAEQVLRDLAGARAALAVGDHAGADAIATPLVGVAETAGHEPTLAEANLVLAAARRAGGDLRGADDAAHASLWAAERGHDDAAAALAWLEMTALAGERRDLAEAESRAGHADAAIARAGNARILRARLDAARGLIAFNRGRHAEALAHLDAARAARVALLGADDVEVARIDAGRAAVLRTLGRLDEARVVLEGVLAIDRARLGDQHPDVARDLHNLAGVLRIGGDLDGALVRYTEALAIEEAVLGAAHVDTARTRNSIALVMMAKGELDAAEAMLRQALATLEQIEHGERATVTHNLGLVEQRRGRHAEALARFDEASARYKDSIGSDAEAAVRLLVDRAESEAALGKKAEARTNAATARQRAAELEGEGARAVEEDAEAIVRAHDAELGRQAGADAEIPAPRSGAGTGTAQRDVGVYGSAQPWDRQ